MTPPKIVVATALACVMASLGHSQFNPSPAEVLESSAPGDGDLFGWDVAIDGEWAAIGTHDDKVHVFRLENGHWSEHQVLTGGLGQRFGVAVAIDGDILAVGDITHDGSSMPLDAGAVFVYRLLGQTWQYESELSASDGVTGDYLGNDVAVSGNTIVAGTAGSGSAAYVFAFDGTRWDQQAKLTGSGANFGETVSVSGDTAVVGGSSVDTHVFQRTGGTWTLDTVLDPPTPPGSLITECTTVSGDLLALTSKRYVYLYRRTGQQWVQELLIEEPQPNSDFGDDVAISDDQTMVLIGAPLDSISGVGSSGAVYLYRHFDGAWSLKHVFTKPDPDSIDRYGFSVALSGRHVLIGCGWDDPGGINAAGTAHLVDLNPVWEDLSSGLAGVSGPPVLSADGSLQQAEVSTLLLTNARSFSLAPLVLGASALSASFKGGVLLPSPDLLLPFTTNGFGSAKIEGPWPSGIASGLSMYAQWWVQDPTGPVGFAASNALLGTTP